LKTPFLSPGKSIPGLPGTTVGDFWAWSYSDVMNNTTRSVFAEFIVGSALGVTDKPRLDWEPYDLKYKKIKVEVKASGFIQSWNKERISKVAYDIAKRKRWYRDTNTYSKESKRWADVYVFCLFAELNRDIANVLDIRQWRFWIMTTKEIVNEFGGQKTVALSRIEAKAHEVGYDQIQAKIEELFAV
jgi:hypothetical protein